MLIFYGWRYYHRRDHSFSQGKCPHCELRTKFRSYTSTRYAMLQFLPLFPAGKFRIVKECPNCKDAYQIGYRKWKRLKNKELPEVIRSLQNNPSLNRREEIIEAIESAIIAEDLEVLDGIVNATSIISSSDTELIDWAAYAYEHLGNLRKASELYIKLSQLDRENTTAYLELAEHCLQLAKEDPPRAHNFLIQTIPVLIVPTMLLFLLASIFSQIFIKAPEHVYAVNGTTEAYSISINHHHYELPPGEIVRVKEKYGTLDIEQEGEDDVFTPFEAEIEADYKDRLISKTAFIINPDRVAVLIKSDVPYVSEDSKRKAETQLQVLVGEAFQKIPSIDYPFQEMPNEIDLPEGTDVEYKSHLEVAEVSNPFVTLDRLTSNGYDSEAKQFIQNYSLLKLDAPEFLYAFNSLASFEEMAQHTAPLLSDRPVRMEWHQFYQEAQLNLGNRQELVTQYDNMILDEPSNADLIYLRGRIASNRKERLSFFRQACKVDPNGAYAHYGLACQFCADGEFRSALQQIHICLQTSPNNADFHSLYRELLIATFDWEGLIDDLPKVQQLSELSYQDLRIFLMALVRAGNTDFANESIQEYASEIYETKTEEYEQLSKYLKYLIADFEGDLDSVRQILKSAEIGYPDTYKLHLLEKNLRAAISDCFKFNTSDQLVSLLFIRTIALLDHNESIVESCDFNINSIKDSVGESQRNIIHYLYDSTPPNLDTVLSSAFTPESLRVILWSLGAQHSRSRLLFWNHAKILNFYPDSYKVIIDELI